MKISNEGRGLVCVNFLSTPLFQGEIEGEEIELASIGVHHPQQGCFVVIRIQNHEFQTAVYFLLALFEIYKLHIVSVSEK